MKNKEIIIFACLGAILCSLVPMDLSAITGTFAEAGTHLNDKTKSIQDFLFGPGLRWAGIFGFAWGVIQWVMGQSFSLVASFLVGGASTAIAPSIFNAILPATTMLLP